MGIDAEMIIKYRGDKPTEDQLTRWSWDLARAVGTKTFFISDGMPAAEYEPANKVWHEAFNAHPLYAEWERLRNQDWEAGKAVHTKILAELGKAPERLRRAIDLTGAVYGIDEEYEADIPPKNRQPGKVYFQDGPEVLAADNEWLLNVSLYTRYYGIDYERGDILALCAVAEWVEVNMQPCEVWYGGDSSGVLLERFDNDARTALRKHLYSPRGRDYFSYSGSQGAQQHPTPCGLCVKDENRFQQFGSGRGGNYVAVSCGGCGKSFRSDDAGVTWTTEKPE